MKLTTLITAASSVAAIAYAGEPAPMAPMAPVSASCWDGWFAGTTYGQFETDANLDDDSEEIDFDMFTLHVGRDLDRQVLGCDLSAYLELGIITGDLSDQFQSGDVDFEIVPLTFNLKAERALFGGVKGYITAGIGYAFAQIDAGSESIGDGGFYAQASIGLAYDINQNWEIYGGGRWLYLEDLDFGISDIEVDDAVAWEVGLRYHF